MLRSTAELQIIATEGCGEFPNGATSVVSRSANVRCNEMEWNPNCVLSFDCLVADRSFSYRLDLNFVVVCAINSTEERVAVGWRGEGEMLLLLLLEGGLAACCGFRFPILVHLFHELSLVGVVIFVLDRRVCQPRPTCAIISLRACVNSVITRTMSELHTLKR